MSYVVVNIYIVKNRKYFLKNDENLPCASQRKLAACHHIYGFVVLE